MTLSDVRRGQTIRIKEIQDPHTREQALRFGLAEGTEVRCAEVLPKGPVVLSRGALQVAIGRRLSGRIAVEVVRGRSGHGH